MLTRLWKTTKRFNKDARIEEHTIAGEQFYSFRDRLDRPFDIEAEEIPTLIKEWSMEEVEID